MPTTQTSNTSAPTDVKPTSLTGSSTPLITILTTSTSTTTSALNTLSSKSPVSIVVYYCNFNGQTDLSNICGSNNNPITSNGNSKVELVLNEVVPDVTPTWTVTDYTSISKQLNFKILFYDLIIFYFSLKLLQPSDRH